MKRVFTSLLIAACIAGALPMLTSCNGASEIARESIGKDGNKGFMFKTLTRGDHVRQYGLFIPLTYKETNKYPVIIFLQGIGEGSGMGQGDGKNLTVGLGPFVALQKNTFPFICIFPQSGGSWDANSEYADDVITALNDVSKNFSVDQDRVSLTGLSTGGYGTYAIGAKYHDRFAAIVPMGSNGSDLGDADKLTHLAVRAYCSESGDIFAGSNDHDMVDRIKSLGGRAEFIQTPTSGHDCWEYVYGQSDLFGWLQAQRRQGSTGSTAPVSSPRTAAAAIATPAVSPVRSERAGNVPAVFQTPY